MSGDRSEGGNESAGGAALSPDSRLAALPEDKRQRIIEACIKEFKTHGFNGASTNAITERAGISKGLLFHYFGNKRDLYLYLVDHVADYFISRFAADTAAAPADVWQRMTWWSLEKLKMYQSSPLYYAFFSKAVFEIPKSLEAEMAKRYQRLTDFGVGVFQKGLDTSSFRSDIDHAKAVEIIVMTLDGLGRKYLERLKRDYDFDRWLSLRPEIERDLNEYLAILKIGICDPDKVR